VLENRGEVVCPWEERGVEVESERSLGLVRTHFICLDGLVPLRRVSSSVDSSVTCSRLAITGFAGLCQRRPPPTWPRRLVPRASGSGCGWQPNGDRRRREAES
jgi:hypothetical protein